MQGLRLQRRVITSPAGMTATTWRDSVASAGNLRATLLTRAPQIVTFVLALLLAVQAALILVGIAGKKPVAATPALATSQPRTPAYDAVSIGNAHLFGAAATPAATGDAANAPSTTMNLVLAGVLAADDPKEGYAIIGENAAGAKVVSVGEEVPGGAKLHSVYADRAVIERVGALESVYLPQGTGVGGPRSAPPPIAAAPQPSELLDRMRKLVTDQPGVLNQVMRPQPVYRAGKLQGVRVYPGPNRQAFSRLGLRAGDMVTAINGTPLDGNQRFEEIFNTLGSATDARVTVTRNGQPQDLTLNLTQVAAEADALTAPDGSVPMDQMPAEPGNQ
jgi:general secretion pathway protein C